MAERKDNSGALFRNENPKSDKHPPYGGKAVIAGVEYFMDAWVNEGPKGKYFAVKFKPTGQSAAPRGEESQARPTDEDTPF